MQATDISNLFGGSVWESNPPCRIVAGNTGFEVREGHQNPMHSQQRVYGIGGKFGKSG